MQRFSIPIPLKSHAVVLVPEDIDADDWEMVSTIMVLYVQRWSGYWKERAMVDTGTCVDVLLPQPVGA